jgi:hypothetical protein
VHSEQTDAPLPLNVPIGQRVQVTLLALAANVPGGHGKQAAMSAAPEFGLYWPAAHGVHASVALALPGPLPAVPAGQAEHADWPVAANDPDGHVAQVLTALAPVVVENVPAAHGEQAMILDVAPTTVPYDPGGQEVQVSVP